MSRLFLFLILFCHLSFASAEPLAIDDVPEPLKPWVDWVLEDEKDYQCPFFFSNFNQKHCAWPGKLLLNLNSKQSQFTSYWQVYKESWIELPGSSDYWPQQVTINDKTALVMNKNNRPAIKLNPGSYKISGHFFWNRIPETLAIPKNNGLLNLSIHGKTIPYPIIKNNAVWLKESDSGQKKPENIINKMDFKVFRKIDDNIPLQLTTILELNVSGEQREVTLAHALLADFIPISLRSPLPARIEANGSLLIQLKPGRWQIEINARSPKPLSQLSFNINNKEWPQTEIWSFQARPFQRIVEIKNLTSIDPSQSNLPAQWKSFPAYQLKQGDSMQFTVIRRGDPEPEPNQLSLNRQLWLDFDGAAYTVADHIDGRMTKGWRLDALSETELGQVKINGQNQLITKIDDSNKLGVEVRRGQINLQADSRIKGDIAHLNAVGWDQDFHQVSAELNIPPGWRLLAASGVDNVPNSWLSGWTLLDLFLLLIAALAISRLWSIYWGVFGLLTLALCWHESQAPHFIWLNILAAIALIRVLPENKFQRIVKWYRNLCWLSLVIIIIPFMVDQIRIGLYPQLERQWQSISPPPVKPLVRKKPSMPASVQLEALDAEEDFGQKAGMAKMRTPLKRSITSYSMSDKVSSYPAIDQIDPDANIQTGPGLPQWTWHKIRLSWNGAVDRHQQVRLWYLSPGWSMMLNFLRVILVLLLSLLMFDLIKKKFTLPPSIFGCLLIIPLMMTPSSDSYAAFPDQELLDNLKTRLLKAPDCLPVCAQIPLMNLSINPKTLSITLHVHTQQAVAIPLPAQLEQWFPNQVKINGIPSQAMLRSNDGYLWLSLEPGSHTIELDGMTPANHKFTLPLPLKPHRNTINAKGWDIEGIHENGRSDSQLILSRVKSMTKQAEQTTLEPASLPAFIRVERTLHLGLDWRISTRVIRVVRNNSAIALKIPLLDNESVTTEKIRIKNRQVLINMSAQQNSVSWESVLKKTSQINLFATKTEQWTELWRVDAGPSWHIQTDGISVVHHQDQGRWFPEWRPWPGEKVSLSITRPPAVNGPTLTIDRTTLKLKPGKRSLESELELSIRSSKGSQQTITLPDQAQLQSVKINGKTQPIRQQGAQLILPIKPGHQDIKLLWRENQQQSSIFSTSTINLGVDSVNNHINVRLGQDRWVLFTSGPKFGPAVLFWGILIVIALLSVGLGRVSLTPLKHWQWFLLLIGLSQIPLESALIVIFWLIALGLRAEKQLSNPSYFNLTQIGLGLLTLVSILLLFIAVQHGLLGSPDMQIAGNQSSAFNLNWYQDRSKEQLPTATIISVPLTAYRILMLLWSLWLAISLLNWLKWGWNCFSSNGLWKKTQKVEKSTVLSEAEKS